MQEVERVTATAKTLIQEVWEVVSMHEDLDASCSSRTGVIACSAIAPCPSSPSVLTIAVAG
jgi:hypothetical protein